MKITNDLFISNQKRDVSNNDNLGKDAFLRILMTQLQNQDPLEPMKDKDFIAQMAQFSSLEQLSNMNTHFESLLEQGNQVSFMGYGELIGKNISWNEAIEGENGEPTFVNKEGILQSVTLQNGVPVLTMDDGSEVTEEMISNIFQSNSNVFLEASHLIGKQVTWLKAGQEQIAQVQGVRNENNGLKLRLDNNEIIDLQDILSIALDTAPSQ
ncbi:flagellar hook assembly protein FlgD (plasmid) [Rossellomorea sp. AcN35-11]|nr:flagellar hook assembly protein FlgD [Rossellomorea aquimaris]WJV32286.1 flagellar hook assembly protein FlgD [Rossellomorea sp. AcN35-11]